MFSKLDWFELFKDLPKTGLVLIPRLTLLILMGLCPISCKFLMVLLAPLENYKLEATDFFYLL